MCAPVSAGVAGGRAAARWPGRGSSCGWTRPIRFPLTSPWQDGTMKLRIFTEPQQGADYATLRRVALAAEELDFDAFFRSDHYLKMGSNSGLPGPTDSWATLAGLAVETSRIRLGPAGPDRPAASGSGRW